MQAVQKSKIAELEEARTANASLTDDLNSVTSQLADARQAQGASSSQLQAVQVCSMPPVKLLRRRFLACQAMPCISSRGTHGSILSDTAKTA